MQKDSTEAVNSPRPTEMEDIEVNQPNQVVFIIEEVVEQLCTLKSKLVDMIQIEDQICTLCRKRSRPKIRLRQPRASKFSSFKITSDDNTGDIKEIICAKSDNDSYGPENFELEPVQILFSKSNHSIIIEKQQSHRSSNASETKPVLQNLSTSRILSTNQKEQVATYSSPENSSYGPENLETVTNIQQSLSQSQSKSVNSDVRMPSIKLRTTSHRESSNSGGQIFQPKSKDISVGKYLESVPESLHQISSGIESGIISPREIAKKEEEDSKFFKDTVQAEDIPVIILEIAKNKSAKEFFVAILAEAVQSKFYRINVVDKETEKLLGYFCVEDPIFQKARCDGMFDDFLSLFGLNNFISYADLKCGISTEAMTKFPWK